jgi:hypothetical protein
MGSAGCVTRLQAKIHVDISLIHMLACCRTSRGIFRSEKRGPKQQERLLDVTKKRFKYLWLSVTAAVAVTVVWVSYGVRMSRTPQIAGIWSCDATALYNQIYSKYGMTAVRARSVVRFNGDGTYVSEDNATIKATSGRAKGTSVPYRGRSRGTFTFRGRRGTAKETDGVRTANGRELHLTLPNSMSLELSGKSSLTVVEDYGPMGQLKYVLHRQR